MTKQQVFIAMFRALDCLNDESSSEELRDYLSDANPYLFDDRGSVDPSIEADFFASLGSAEAEDLSPEALYKHVQQYLNDKTPFGDRFADITLEEWSALCAIIVQEGSTE